MSKHGSDHQIVEEAGVAFDPTTQHLDLTKKEKLKTTALMLAIQAYSQLIIKDAEYLREAHNQSRSSDDEGLKIRPATIDEMAKAAEKFYAFISDDEYSLSDDE